jgi:hypothetical protein
MLGAIPADYHYGDYMDAILCWFFLVTIVFLPLFVLFLMCKNKRKFKQAKAIEKRYKQLKKSLKKRAKYE